ncbi:hypothetical protein V8C86DRAFT_1083168 [Haematococcus lacustris]
MWPCAGIGRGSLRPNARCEGCRVGGCPSSLCALQTAVSGVPGAQGFPRHRRQHFFAARRPTVLSVAALEVPQNRTAAETLLPSPSPLQLSSSPPADASLPGQAQHPPLPLSPSEALAVLEAAAAADSSEDVDDHHLLYLLGEVAWGFESAAPPELLPIGQPYISAGSPGPRAASSEPGRGNRGKSSSPGERPPLSTSAAAGAGSSSSTSTLPGTGAPGSVDKGGARLEHTAPHLPLSNVVLQAPTPQPLTSQTLTPSITLPVTPQVTPTQPGTQQPQGSLPVAGSSESLGVAAAGAGAAHGVFLSRLAWCLPLLALDWSGACSLLEQRARHIQQQQKQQQQLLQHSLSKQQPAPQQQQTGGPAPTPLSSSPAPGLRPSSPLPALPPATPSGPSEYGKDYDLALSLWLSAFLSQLAVHLPRMTCRDARRVMEGLADLQLPSSCLPVVLQVQLQATTLGWVRCLMAQQGQGPQGQGQSRYLDLATLCAATWGGKPSPSPTSSPIPSWASSSSGGGSGGGSGSGWAAGVDCPGDEGGGELQEADVLGMVRALHLIQVPPARSDDAVACLFDTPLPARSSDPSPQPPTTPTTQTAFTPLPRSNQASPAAYGTQGGVGGVVAVAGGQGQGGRGQAGLQGGGGALGSAPPAPSSQASAAKHGASAARPAPSSATRPMPATALAPAGQQGGSLRRMLSKDLG